MGLARILLVDVLSEERPSQQTVPTDTEYLVGNNQASSALLQDRDPQLSKNHDQFRAYRVRIGRYTTYVRKNQLPKEETGSSKLHNMLNYLKCPGTGLLNPSSSHVQSIDVPWEYLASNAKDNPERVFPSCISALVSQNPFPCLDKNTGHLPLMAGGLKKKE